MVISSNIHWSPRSSPVQQTTSRIGGRLGAHNLLNVRKQQTEPRFSTEYSIPSISGNAESRTPTGCINLSSATAQRIVGHHLAIPRVSLSGSFR